jgi:hypothetical protein
MEFFATTPIPASPRELQERLTVAALPELCASVERVLEDTGATGTVWCVWGQYRVSREPINGGVRFTLPECPNALAWTVTTGHPPEPEVTVVHCTIARREHDPDFIETIEAFVDHWRQGLERAFPAAPAPGVSREARISADGLARLERHLEAGTNVSDPVLAQWIRRYGEPAREVLRRHGRYRDELG